MKFRASGKLLLTAEYAVLRGALALSLPTKFGQELSVKPAQENVFSWTSLDRNNNTWFKTTFTHDLQILKTTDQKIAEKLMSIFNMAKKENPHFLSSPVQAETNVDFDLNWGLGTSSTLIALIANWAKIDALKLFFATQKGSGYDVATAVKNTPITYTLNQKVAAFHSVSFNPAFRHNLFFVYLGKKQRSDKEVTKFSQQNISDADLLAITALTKQILNCTDLAEFSDCITKHEEITSGFLDYQTVKQKLFADYPGALKSLGAWGGDFILAVGTKADVTYFHNKGLQTVLSWEEMIGNQ